HRRSDALFHDQGAPGRARHAQGSWRTASGACRIRPVAGGAAGHDRRSGRARPRARPQARACPCRAYRRGFPLDPGPGQRCNARHVHGRERGQPSHRAEGRDRPGAAMTTNPVLVRTRSVSKTFRTGTIEAEALRDVSIDLHAGELVLLMGPSGSGKTTLLYILSGLLRPTAGDVELCGTPITRLSEKDASEVRRRHVGFVFQTYNLFPALSAIDNVGEVLVMKDTPRSQAQARAAEILTRVGLEARLHHRPGELSGGERQ